MEISLSNPVKKFDVSYSERYPMSKEVKHMIVNAERESDISDFLIDRYGYTALYIEFIKWN